MVPKAEVTDFDHAVLLFVVLEALLVVLQL